MVATWTAPYVISVSVSPPLLGELIVGMLTDLDPSVECVMGEPAVDRPDLVITSDPDNEVAGVPCILVPEPGAAAVEAEGARVAVRLDELLAATAEEVARLTRVDRRSRPRRATEIHVTVRPLGRAVPGRCVDLSEAGARVELDGDVTIGDAVEIAFEEEGLRRVRRSSVVGTRAMSAGRTEVRVAFTDSPSP